MFLLGGVQVGLYFNLFPICSYGNRAVPICSIHLCAQLEIASQHFRMGEFANIPFANAEDRTGRFHPLQKRK